MVSRGQLRHHTASSIGRDTSNGVPRGGKPVYRRQKQQIISRTSSTQERCGNGNEEVSRSKFKMLFSEDQEA